MRRPSSHFRLTLTLAVMALAAAQSPAAAAPALAGRRILIVGDSITQDGRYVTFLEYYLLRQSPPIPADIISIGLGSETISGLSEPGHPFPRPCLHARLERALELTKPELVFACYGMNDGIYHAPSPEREAAFRQGLERLAAAVHARGADLLLITPPVWDSMPLRAKLAPEGSTEFGYGRPYARYDDVLASFASIETSMVAPRIDVIDLHTAMRTEIAARRAIEPQFTFSPDGVHPADEGHLFIARTVAASLGLVLPATDKLAVELARINADPLFALVAARRAARSNAWLAYVGYTREKTVAADNAEAGEAEAARLGREIAKLVGGR